MADNDRVSQPKEAGQAPARSHDDRFSDDENTSGVEDAITKEEIEGTAPEASSTTESKPRNACESRTHSCVLRAIQPGVPKLTRDLLIQSRS